MTLDDFFVDGKKAWDKELQRQEEEKRQKEEAERRKRIEKLKSRRKEAVKTEPAVTAPPPAIIPAGNFKIEILPDRYRIHEVPYRGSLYVVDWGKDLLDKGNEHTQEEWIALTQSTEWKIPDLQLYHATLSTLYRQREHAVQEQKKLVEELQQFFKTDFDFNSTYFMKTMTTSTRMEEDLDTLTHNWGYPSAQRHSLALNKGKGFEGDMETLLGSRDLTEIDKVYEWISGKKHLWGINVVLDPAAKYEKVVDDNTKGFMICYSSFDVRKRKSRGVVVVREIFGGASAATAPTTPAIIPAGTFQIESLPDRYRIHGVPYRGDLYVVDWSKIFLEEGKGFQENAIRLTKNTVWKIPNLQLYHATLSTLYRRREHAVQEQKKLVEELRQLFKTDFDNKSVNTSTRLKYVAQGPDTITHDWGYPWARQHPLVPVKHRAWINASSGLEEQMEVLLGSRDLAEIEKVYEWVGGWKPYFDKRNPWPQSAEIGAVFGGYNGEFCTNSYTAFGGRSRGVVVVREISGGASAATAPTTPAIIPFGNFKIESLPDRYRIHEVPYQNGLYVVDWSKEFQRNWHWQFVQPADKWKIPDLQLYHATLSTLYRQRKHAVKEQKELVEELRQLFKTDFVRRAIPYGMMTSTRIKYAAQGPDTVVHDWGYPSARYHHLALVGPDALINASSGLERQMEVLLGSRDLAKIEKVYEWISGKKLHLWRLHSAPAQDDRVIVRDVRFLWRSFQYKVEYYYRVEDKFGINCLGRDEDSWSYRGVDVTRVR